MIEKVEGKYFLICDICDSDEGPFDEWAEAVEFSEGNEWGRRKDKLNGWQDICPVCKEEGER